jgi:peptide-methionine (S)-S-oxide reductase
LRIGVKFDTMSILSRNTRAACISACFLAGAISFLHYAREKTASTLTVEQIHLPKGVLMEKAMFAAGCFWGVEETFRTMQGVIKTTVGYAGGTLENPTYEQVCTDRTGHAEVVLVEFDPAQVSYAQLLDAFWNAHDPTTLNRQGPDTGTQYRSAIFYHSPEQEAAAEASKERLARSGKFKRPIVTEITAAGPFYAAEEYHQQYLLKRGEASCHVR